MKILVAEDDAISRRMLESALTKWEYEVVLARDGAEAWEILQSAEAPPLAILDWQMPGMDGLEICRKVRQRQESPYTYIILLTARDQKEDVLTGMEAGADDYLTKPFDPHKLQVRLRAGKRILDLQAQLLASLDALGEARRREVEIGAKIQQTLLLGQPPDAVPEAQAATLTIPSQQIDGDFYDFFQHHNRCFDVLVGDVMGKGVPAALLGAAIKSHFMRALSQLLSISEPDQLPQPEEIVARVHQEVTGRFIGLEFFATFIYARFDLAAGRIAFVDAGHTRTLHFRKRDGACVLLEGNNMPLGSSEKEVYRQVVVPFASGDLFTFYSDGVTEARSPSGELYGEDRLVALVQAHGHLQPQALVEEVRRAVIAYSGSEKFADDLTCVAVQIMEEGRGKREEGTENPTLNTQYPIPDAHASITVSGALEDLASIRQFVRSFCRDLSPPGLEEEGVDALELAVNEAASNVMRHAYSGRADRRITIEMEAFPDRIVVRLQHRGEGFDPAAVPPPDFDGSREGGFGIHIIQATMDAVDYSCDAQGTHCIRLIKMRKGSTQDGVDSR
ncbi:MAG TPA: SpoIIE family protein phosphatase [Chthonomonadaceae bacterium]|nr:SpoIIE family protein phosphatase [Chthonomonadaceae bacterium]